MLGARSAFLPLFPSFKCPDIMKVKQCRSLSREANGRRCWRSWAGGDRPFFSISNHPFPEGKGGWRAAPCPEGALRPARACGTVLQSAEVGELTWTSALQSCPPTTASPWDFLWHGATLSFCGSRLRYPSLLWRGSVRSVLGCVSLLFP